MANDAARGDCLALAMAPAACGRSAPRDAASGTDQTAATPGPSSTSGPATTASTPPTEVSEPSPAPPRRSPPWRCPMT